MLQKTYEIAGHEINLRCSALTPRTYRAEFNRDMMLDFKAVFELTKSGFSTTLTMIAENLLYIMAKEAGDESGTVEEFLGKLPPMAAYASIPALIDRWNETMETTSTSKKKQGQPSEK